MDIRSFYNPVNLPISTDKGCKGCGGEWRSRDFHEGKCSRCSRCLSCCGDRSVKFSCAWRYERDYGGSNPESVVRRLAHNKHVDAGIRGYWNKQ